MRTKASHWSPPNPLDALHLLFIVSLECRQLLLVDVDLLLLLHLELQEIK